MLHKKRMKGLAHISQDITPRCPAQLALVSAQQKLCEKGEFFDDVQPGNLDRANG